MTDCTDNATAVLISELSGRALDYAVAQCEGRTIRRDPMGFHDRSYWVWEEVPSGLGGILVHKSVYMKIGPTGEERYSPSTDWSQGGPIIERESLQITPCEDMTNWSAGFMFRQGMDDYVGPSPLVAAMRCYVASKAKGDSVMIPKEML